MNILVEYMQKLGLSDNEIKLYKGLLTSGPSTIMDLSKQVGMKRITCHFNIESLIQKGLVVQLRTGARRKVVAEPPEKLEELIQQKEKEIERLRDELPSMIKTIQSFSPAAKTFQGLDIQYYEGKDAVKNIYDEVLQAKEMRAFVTDMLDYYFPENENRFVKAHNTRDDYYIWEIMNDAPINYNYAARMNADRYQFRISDTPMELVDYLIYDGKVAMIDCKNGNEKIIQGIVIDNELFYLQSKSIFTFTWNLLSKQE